MGPNGACTPAPPHIEADDRMEARGGVKWLETQYDEAPPEGERSTRADESGSRCGNLVDESLEGITRKGLGEKVGKLVRRVSPFDSDETVSNSLDNKAESDSNMTKSAVDNATT